MLVTARTNTGRPDDVYPEVAARMDTSRLSGQGEKSSHDLERKATEFAKQADDARDSAKWDRVMGGALSVLAAGSSELGIGIALAGGSYILSEKSARNTEEADRLYQESQRMQAMAAAKARAEEAASTAARAAAASQERSEREGRRQFKDKYQDGNTRANDYGGRASQVRPNLDKMSHSVS
jgi:hypothetical protein